LTTLGRRCECDDWDSNPAICTFRGTIINIYVWVVDIGHIDIDRLLLDVRRRPGPPGYDK
jgi:hypothetical protein